jgi:hypothetical protein
MYITILRKIKQEANQTPLEMPLKELLAYALNIEEAALNSGTDVEGNLNNSNVEKTETIFPRK